MEEEPKSSWRKPWKGRRAFLFWFLIVPIAAFLGACLLALISSGSMRLVNPQIGFIGYVLLIMFWLIIAIVAAFGFGNFILWVCDWRNFKRFLFGCACFATVIALFYAEENWRGKHEWESFKRQWEARGENFDRDSVLPPTVPDDQNFAMSPVWIAEIKRNFKTEPKHAEDWYGDRIYSDEVANYTRLLPFSAAAVIGTNEYWNLPETPDTLGYWPATRMSDLRPWQSFYRNLQQTNPSANIAIAPNPQTPAQDVLLALSKYDPLIEKLRQDSQLPYSRFPVEYNKDQNPAGILLPHLAYVKRAAQVLNLRAIAELQNGQSDKALADVNLMLRLVDADRNEPFLISHLVRLAVFQIALQPIYEGLANHQWSDSQLAELDSKLSNVDFLTDYKYSLRGETIFLTEGVLDYLRRHREEIGNLSSDMSPGSPSFPAGIVADAIPAGWFYQNELHSARAIEENYLPNVDTNRGILSPSSVRATDTAVQAETRHTTPYNILEKMLLPTFSTATLRVAYGQTSANLARVAIALERYRMANGNYPDSLDAISPQFMSSVPHDIINGQPLHYQRTADGQFIVYSVGWNETDDGGVVVMKTGSKHGEAGATAGVDSKQGDWVWKYPVR